MYGCEFLERGKAKEKNVELFVVYEAKLLPLQCKTHCVGPFW